MLEQITATVSNVHGRYTSKKESSPSGREQLLVSLDCCSQEVSFLLCISHDLYRNADLNSYEKVIETFEVLDPEGRYI